MSDIKNQNDLNVAMREILEQIIHNVSEKISDMLQEQIEKDVFTTPNEWYERTEEFEKAWRWTDVKSTITSITTELFYDSSEVTWRGKEWQHGNPGESAAENLADILNLAYNNYNAGYTSGLMFGKRHFSHKRRPYWKNLIDKLFDKGELGKMFDEEFAKFGIVKI